MVCRRLCCKALNRCWRRHKARRGGTSRKVEGGQGAGRQRLASPAAARSEGQVEGTAVEVVYSAL